MNKNTLYISIISIAVILFMFNMENPTVRKPISNPLLVDFNGVHDFAKLKPGHIKRATRYALESTDMILNEILELKDASRTFENTLVRIDDMYAGIEAVWSPGYLMGSTHTEKRILDEGLESSRTIQKYMTDLAMNEDLYTAVMAYSKSAEAIGLTGYKKKFLDDTILDYKRSGFDLPKEERDKVKTIFNELSDLGLEFSKNISGFQDTLFVSKKEMEGLPESYQKEHLQDDGRYAIDMPYPSYVPFMEFSESDEAREQLQFKFKNRAKESNLSVLDNIISKRREMVQVLGYASYAEYRTEDRMAQNPDNVWNFEHDLKKKVRPKGQLDVDEMRKIKSKRTGKDAKVIQPWEAGFYYNKILKENFDLDPEEVRKYFEFNNVTQGLFTIYQKLFGVWFKEVENPSVWHEDVLMYEVYDRATRNLIGRFYLDMFPRPNKYGHAAAFSVTMGKMTESGYQKPATALVCNFPKPSEFQPSLLTHDNVETYFHEIEHPVKNLLKCASSGIHIFCCDHFIQQCIRNNFTCFIMLRKK